MQFGDAMHLTENARKLGNWCEPSPLDADLA